jgi:hypothetical protein
LDEKRREELIQLQVEIAGLKSQVKAAHSEVGAIQFCLIRAIRWRIRIHLARLSGK